MPVALIVLFVQRRPAQGQVSIERLFDQVRACLPSHVASRTVAVPYPSKGLLGRLRNLAFVAGQTEGDLVHVPGDSHYLVLAVGHRPVVLTIHDCAVLHRLKGWRREAVRRLWFEWPARRAAVVTTISEATREDLKRWLPAGVWRKVVVVPNCVRDEFRPSPRPFDEHYPVFLQVGTGWNKNVVRVAKALEGLGGRLNVVGVLSEQQKAELASLDLEVCSLGRLSDAELVEAYRQCDALVFASLAEGFGLPIIEAQAVGRPVITSRTSSMPEVAGKGALLVDPVDVADIRRAARQIIADAGLRETLVREGFANVERFRSARIAQLYASVYERAIREHGTGPA